MAKPKQSVVSPFDEAMRTIREAKKGQEAAMYGPLRDLFCDLLGYTLTASAVPFDPTKLVFTNTATIFGPRSDLSKVPFDLLLVSRIYRYFYALTCRMSYLNMNRSHVYPTNLRQLPWNDAISAIASKVEALRGDLVSACENHFRTEAAMFAALDALRLRKPMDPTANDFPKSSAKIPYFLLFNSSRLSCQTPARLPKTRHLSPERVRPNCGALSFDAAFSM